MKRLPPDEVDTLIARTPDAGLRKKKREWFNLGFERPEFIKAVQVFEKMLADMEAALVNHEWLAGSGKSSAVSLATKSFCSLDNSICIRTNEVLKRYVCWHMNWQAV